MGVGVITIRRFGVADIPAAVDLIQDFEDARWSRGAFEHELEAPGRRYVAALDENLVGFGGLMKVGDVAHINNLFVAPRWTGRGIGRRLLGWLFEEALAMGARNVTLEVRSGNNAAVGLYHRFGMAVEGVRHRYYGEHDALIMWARNVDAPDHEWRSA